jgi:hypothetical protein
MRKPTGCQLDISKALAPFVCQSDNSRVLIPATPISFIGLAPAERNHSHWSESKIVGGE